MRRIEGTIVSYGLAKGKALVLSEEASSAIQVHLKPNEIQGEIDRYKMAVEKLSNEWMDLADQVKNRADEDVAGIFVAHAHIVKDPALSSKVIDYIESNQVNAEWSLLTIIKGYKGKLSQATNPYIRERITDLEHIAFALMKILSGDTLMSSVSHATEDTILIGEDLSPSDLILLENPHVKGLVLEGGSRTSHTAILAKALDLPCLVKVNGIMDTVYSGDIIALDGKKGHVWLNMDQTEATYFEKKILKWNEENPYDLAKEEQHATSDGIAIELLANIELIRELEHVWDKGAEGIGLYRSEFLYLQKAPEIPTEKDHLEMYQSLAEAANGRPLTIRTLDLGGEKYFVEVLKGAKEKNPVMGLRGLRLCLSRKDIFIPQLRALLKVVQNHPNIKVMFPMVTNLEEWREAKQLIKKLAKDMGNLCVPPLGLMVEVPSVALQARQFAEESDFLSIGSNDLLQYTLAMERSNQHVQYLYEPLHPSMMRLVQMVVQGARDANTPLHFCGEMASESPEILALLLGIGIRSISMSPSNLSRVLKWLHSIDVQSVIDNIEFILGQKTAKDVEHNYSRGII